MTASLLLPSTQLAVLQDQILSRTDYTKAEALALCVELDKYRRLLAETHNSNLHVRQAFIKAGLRYISRSGVPSEDYAATHALVKPLYRNGLWSEGPDYCDYVKDSLDWHRAVTGASEYHVIDMATDRYAQIVAPDGTIPVPEASSRKYPVPTVGSVSNDKYMIQRWPSGAYLLVDVGTECDHKNLHDWLSAGYFALWGATKATISCPELKPVQSDAISFGMPDFVTKTVEYGWLHRCAPYTGFSWANVLDDSKFRSLLPKGALLPGWRLKPPKVTVVRGDGFVEVTWKNGWLQAAKRRISWNGGVVKVRDAGLFWSKVREWKV